ncbi:phosphoglycerate mutase [Nitrosospira sp. Is2]|uniref:phosphoglycerate mutase n=1 Tax=Nitrosospira sp. Is2 TaxID=3080532 RepID=UPI0029539093|nr:phosphoglycerate mutase [Nitrosospira sp. Is2]WON72789.1 phosphoglycerate mutase [Nitrosospira sp. Is2]
MNLHLLVPSLFWPDASLPEIYRDLPLPALENLLTKCSRTDDEPEGMEPWLCRAFGVQKQLDWPVAPITLRGDGGERIKAGQDYWIRADPVHLRIERDQAVLADSRVFPIAPEEAHQLTSLLTRHFSANGLDMEFLPLQPDRWYVRLVETPPAHTHLLSDVIDRGINDHLPYGSNNTIWRGLFNEVQMLLHEHPLNQAREGRGEPSINATWFWGGGIMPESLVSDYSQVWSNDDLAGSLALASGTGQAPLPPNAAIWRQSTPSGNHLVVLDSLHGKAQYHDPYGWRESLKQLDHNWFGPLWAMLKQGEIDQVTLTSLENKKVRNFAVRRSDLRKFWRRPKAIAMYAAG